MKVTWGAVCQPLKKTMESLAPTMPPTNPASRMGASSSFGQWRRRASYRTSVSIVKMARR